MGTTVEKAAKYIFCTGFYDIPVVSFFRNCRGGMGQCVSGGRTNPSVSTSHGHSEELDFTNHEIGERYARPASPSLDRRGLGAVGVKTSATTPSVDVYGREEARLRDLFSALRTGLVFGETEFSVLPGIATTAQVAFSIGSSALMEESARKEAQEDGNPPDEEEEEEEEEEEMEEGEERKQEEEYELTVSLYGATWTRDLQMQLTIWPIVGMFANRKLVFVWSVNILRVLGCKRGELNTRALPVAFDSETEFCRCCLLLAYHSDSSGNLHVEDADADTPTPSDGVVPTLSSTAYHVAVSNLDAVPRGLTIPLKLIHQLYGSQEPVTVSIRVWPSTYTSQFAASPVMKVKAGLVFTEFVYLMKEHFHLPTSYTVKLYHNYKPIQLSELLTSRYKSMDCFVISYEGEDASGSLGSGIEGESADTNATLVVSLVGYDVQNVETSLEMKLKDFDTMLRKRFRLGNNSFLIILAEDDFAPQYTSCDNWKCIYPFSLPENTFGAGLRRSMHRLSRRQRGQITSSSQSHGRALPRQLPMEDHGRAFTPEIDKVIELLSSNSRHFPSNAGRFGFTAEELYEAMPMYHLSLEQYGIHPYAIIQVFEVTGPSIPIKFRVLSNHSRPSRQLVDKGKSSDPPRVSRHANVMDINPKWSIHTFLQYIDAVISPASGVRRKRLSLNDRFVDDSEDLSTLSLGELLDLWNPAWWQRKGGSKGLSLKDIDPAEFLLVEKHSQPSTQNTRLQHR